MRPAGGSLRLAVLRYVLLALLSDGEPAHGYALMKAYEERSGVRLGLGGIYRELQRLVGEGFIVPAANPAGADPRRMPYVITEHGREALAAWLAAPVRAADRTAGDDVSYRLALLGDMDPRDAAAFVEELHAELWEQAKAVERQRMHASRVQGCAGGGFSAAAIVLTRRAMHLAADIELVEKLRLQLAENGARGGAQVGARHRGCVPGRVLRRPLRRGPRAEDDSG